jgi:hypothetical protein
MGAAVALPMALSVASAGLSAVSTGMQAQGTAAADQYKAQQLEEAAKYGELKATQTSADMTRNLVTTLGNIDAVRAAAHVDPTSPTGASVRENVEELGNQQRSIKVSSIEQQARMDESNAAFMRQAGDQALLGGDLSIAGTLLKAGSGAIGGGGRGFNLTSTGGLY